MAVISTYTDGLEPNLASILATVLLFSILHRAWRIVYRLFFHPLRKYPGPRLYAASSLPKLYKVSTGNVHRMQQRLHDLYGPVVRIGPDQLSYIEAKAWKDIQGHRVGGHGSFQKDPALMGKQEHPDIIHADDATHSRQRRIFSHAFSDRALKEQEPMIGGYVDLLIAKLKEHSGLDDMNSEGPPKPVDMVRMYNFTTFDVMADLTFGEPLGMLQGGEYVPWVSNIFGSVKFMVMGSFLRVYPMIGRIAAAFLPKSLAEKRKKHAEFAIERVDRRLQYDKDRGDIWSLVQRGADLNNISRGEMYSNAQIFMIAGTETTATLLSGLTYLLCKNPDKMSKLVDEIMGLGSIDQLNVTNLQGLPYLNACLEDALRLYPPAPMVAPRIAPQGGATVCGQYVPGGTTLGIAQYAAYRSPHNFADPLDFVPERWLSSPPERYASDKKDVLQPFSFGPRNCLGKNLAYHEMRLIISRILWTFEIELVGKNFDWLNQHIYGIWEKHPLNVKLKLRDQ
ncbi:cytochrome P450 [Fusarium albosuccineum]|uniref:Cytochrome P450 n=1 Tax=Fusarium albosuccineum TaxID=1237068 RepID=A0A8H4PCR9_9HYPO|nr:cytochrome P450 [Fusarium albosuccineum]